MKALAPLENKILLFYHVLLIATVYYNYDSVPSPDDYAVIKPVLACLGALYVIITVFTFKRINTIFLVLFYVAMALVMISPDLYWTTGFGLNEFSGDVQKGETLSLTIVNLFMVSKTSVDMQAFTTHIVGVNFFPLFICYVCFVYNKKFEIEDNSNPDILDDRGPGSLEIPADIKPDEPSVGT